MTDQPAPPPQQQPQPGGDWQAPDMNNFKFNTSTVVALLYFASMLVGITGIIGVALAYVKKSEAAGTWEESHLTFHIRTFWFGLAAGFIFFLLLFTVIFIPISWLGFIALAVWAIVRSLKALLSAQKHQPIADPQTLLF